MYWKRSFIAYMWHHNILFNCYNKDTHTRNARSTNISTAIDRKSKSKVKNLSYNLRKCLVII